MKKLIFLAAFSLPLLVFSQTEKLKIPEVEIHKTELPKKIITFNAKNVTVTTSPAPWSMPVIKPKNADLYKILTAKTIENLEKIPIAKPNE